MESKRLIIKKTNNTKMKSFRLLDFHTYDERPNNEQSVSSNDANEKTYRKDEATFMIQMFGINETGETCCIYVNDFHPFFYVKVGDNWTQREAKEFISYVNTKIGKYYENSIIKTEFIDKHKLYGFSGGKKHKFIQFIFKNTTVMNKVKNLWYNYSSDNSRKMRKFIYPENSKNGTLLELYESSIPPILRYFHIHSISPSGWIYIPENKVFKPPIKTTTCHYEYICLSNQLKPIEHKETRVPYKICSFDIEASSSHGDFPLPKKSIQTISYKYGRLYLQTIINAKNE
jgi:DNA polymerase elongation subunit (family B)